MVIRFFLLQAHYRSTIDFSNESLKAAEKGLARLFSSIKTLQNLEPSPKSTVDISSYKIKCNDAMNDDLNTPIVLSHLFDAVKVINSAKKKFDLSKEDILELKDLFYNYTYKIFGLTEIEKKDDTQELNGIMKILLEIRKNLKKKRLGYCRLYSGPIK